MAKFPDFEKIKLMERELELRKAEVVALELAILREKGFKGGYEPRVKDLPNSEDLDRVLESCEDRIKRERTIVFKMRPHAKKINQDILDYAKKIPW